MSAQPEFLSIVLVPVLVFVLVFAANVVVGCKLLSSLFQFLFFVSFRYVVIDLFLLLYTLL